MASNSGWSKSVPSGSSSIAQGDDDIRSFKSFMQTWLEVEHYVTDGSTNSAGVLKKGSGRAFTGAAVSALSNPTGDNDGRLFWATNGNLYIANASTSSWSAVADAIQLDSAQSWTAAQEFTALAMTGMFSAITSISTRLTAELGAEPWNSAVTTIPGLSRFTPGDIMLASAETVIGDLTGVLLTTQWPANSVVNFQLKLSNFTGTSRCSIPSGTTVHILGFKTSGL